MKDQYINLILIHEPYQMRQKLTVESQYFSLQGTSPEMWGS